MPPKTYPTFDSEWSDVSGFATPGQVQINFEEGDSSTGATFAPSVNSEDGITASVGFQHSRFGPLWLSAFASPTQFRPWARYPIQKDVMHSFGFGVVEGNKLAAEYVFKHPTFTASVKGLEAFDVKATVAATEEADLGVKLSYDPLRSGLRDYELGARYVTKHASGCVAVGTWNAFGKGSVSLAGSIPNKPYRWGLRVAENGKTMQAAAGMTSPCGRGLSALLSFVDGVVGCKLGVEAPLQDGAWKVRLVAAPLEEKKFGLSLSAQ